MRTEPRPRRRPRGPLLLALTVLSLLAPVSSTRPAEPAPPDPAAILRAATRAYSELRSFQVQVRTEIPYPGEIAAGFSLGGRMQDLFYAEPLVPFRSGVRATEHEWRIRRDQALRVRVGFPDSRGGCICSLPDRFLQVGYDTGTIDARPPTRPLGTVRSRDGKWSTGYYGMAFAVIALDLPFRLFLTRPPEAVVAAERVEYLRSAPEGGRECHVLRLAVAHTLLPQRQRTIDRRFRSATWTLWIDRESSLVWRAEVQEQWERGDASRPDGKTPAVLEVRETYRNQRLNPEFTLDDFLPAPPDPMKLADQKPKGPTAGGPPTEEKPEPK